MPWTPPEDEEALDPRLDPFRERGGTLLDDTGQVAHVFLRVETCWTRTSGHLWWSRWSPPFELVHAYVRDGEGRFTDWLSSGEKLEGDLADWRRGSLTGAGRTYRVVWLDDDESRQVRDDVFSLGD